MSNAFTFGFADWYGRYQSGENIAGIYQQGSAYWTGTALGVAGSFGLGGAAVGLPRVAALARIGVTSQRLQTGLRAYTIAGDAVGIYQSSTALANGTFTPLDLLGFAPTIGYAGSLYRGAKGTLRGSIKNLGPSLTASKSFAAPKTGPAAFADEAAEIMDNAARSRGLNPNSGIRAAMKPRNVDTSKLIPPSSRPFADPNKLARHGDFDWDKYTPIIVETDGTRFWVMDGMTRIENARRAGITNLPAYVYPR